MTDFDEVSYGVVPVYLESATPLYLLIQQHQGHWGFPKGNPDEGETPQEAAVRELKEETGIHAIQLADAFSSTSSYRYSEDDATVRKQVTYFLGVVSDTDTNTSSPEVLDMQWLPYAGARKQLTFDEAKQTLKDAKQYLNEAM